MGVKLGWMSSAGRVVFAARLMAGLFLAGVTPQLQAAERWVRLTTPHFEIYTTDGENEGTEALRVFEQVRYFFLQNSPSKTAPDSPVRIVAFRSEKEYRPYRLNEGAFAYYMRSRKRDYIVMQDLGPEHHKAAVHEYTHLIVEHLGLNLPVWLNEGLADLYSSLEPHGNEALIGRPLAERQATLMQEKWLDLGILLAVDRDSPNYNERNKMSIFYAQSWALTHMLMLGESYGPRFSEFVSAISKGRPAADCFRSIYGKSLAQVNEDLHSYLHRSTVRAALFQVKLSKFDIEPEISGLSPLSVDLALTDLLGAQKKRQSEAAARLQELERENPNNPEIQESLAYLKWQAGDNEQALKHFAQAAALGSNDPDMLFHYSQLLYDSGAAPNTIIDVLQKVVAQRPDYYEARFNLGMLALNTKQWNVAYSVLSQIKTVEPDRAFFFFSALAHCLLNLQNTKQAGAMAMRAKQYANTPDQQIQVSKLIDYLHSLEQESEPISAQSAPAVQTRDRKEQAVDLPDVIDDSPRGEVRRTVPAIQWPDDVRRAEGSVESFECKGPAVLVHLKVANREMVFLIKDPKGIVVRNRDSETFDLTCGPQQPFKLGVIYLPGDETSSVDGEVRELVF